MIDGKYYLVGRSDFSPGKLYIQAEGFQLQTKNKPTITGSMDQLHITPRLANIARKITLPDGSVFETTNNTALDSVLANNNQRTGLMGFVHTLERNMALAIFSIFVTIAVVFAGFKWGLPATSHVIAHALPASASKILSDNALTFLDQHIFKASELDEAQQKALRKHFEGVIVPLYQAQETPEFKLHFRRWSLGKDRNIANVLALPSGDIIATDRFIELAQSQQEIDIVLLHEMGHIVERHALEQVIESSSIVILVSMALGDVSWLADMGIGLGAFLISSFYSRSHETEADQFAYQHSLHAGINPASLGLILTRMEHDMTMTTNATNHENDEKTASTLSTYFSTHPGSAKRIAMGERYQTCFQQNVTICPETDYK